MQLREDNTVAPRLSFDNHLQIISAMWDQPLFDLYAQVRCPIKLVVADRHPLSESEANFMHMRNQGIAKIQELRPDIRVVKMPNTLHDIPLQRPEQLAEEILSN